MNDIIIYEILRYLEFEDLMKWSKICLTSKKFKEHHIKQIQKHIFESKLRYSINLKLKSIKVNDNLRCSDKNFVNNISKFHPIEFRKLSLNCGNEYDKINYYLRNGILKKDEIYFTNHRYVLSRQSDFIYCLEFKNFVNIKIFSNNLLIDSKNNVKTYMFDETIFPIFLIPFSTIIIQVDDYEGKITIYNFLIDIDNRLPPLSSIDYKNFSIHSGCIFKN